MVDSGMAGNIRSIMGQGAEGKGVLVGIAALRQQFTNEIPGANVMHQIAEFDAAKWIVAKVLYDCSAISVGVGFLELRFRETRVSLKNQWSDLVRPQQVNNLLMGQHGIP